MFIFISILIVIFSIYWESVKKSLLWVINYYLILSYLILSERVMGRHGLGMLNDNGGKLLDFCEENGPVIGGTVFEHKKIHKLTWLSLEGRA